MNYPCLEGGEVFAVSCAITAQGIFCGILLVHSDDRIVRLVNPDNEEEVYPVLNPGQGTHYNTLARFPVISRS